MEETCGKIPVTRQFFKARGPQGHFFEKTKTRFQILSSMCPKFQVCIVFRLARRSRTTHRHISQVKIGVYSTGCWPHGDFDSSSDQKSLGITKKRYSEKFRELPEFMLEGRNHRKIALISLINAQKYDSRICCWKGKNSR